MAREPGLAGSSPEHPRWVYEGDSVGPARVQGTPQGRLLDKRRGEGVVVLSVGFCEEAESGWDLPAWLGVSVRLGGVG